MKTSIEVNKAKCDWITATSYERNFKRHWVRQMDSWKGELSQRKLMQYDGEEVETEGGMIRVLSGRQSGREHYMIQITSALADVYLKDVTNQVEQGIASLTRMDLQVTVRKPKDWSQFDFLVEMKESGRSLVSWVESIEKKGGHMLQTVGIGSRKSDRYLRVYTKPSEEGLLLRFEVEYKGERARAAMRAMRGDRGVMSQILRYEVERLKTGLTTLGEAKGVRVRVKKMTSVEKTVRWLIVDCLPVMERHLNDHDSTGVLRDAIQRMIDRVDRQNTKGGYYE